MGCFLACFGSSKDKKRRKKRHKVLPRELRKGGCNGVEYTVSLAHTEKPSSPVSDHQTVVIKDTSQERLSLSCRNRVTFNSNVKTYDNDQVTEVSLVEEEEAAEKREETLEKPKRYESNSEHSSITSSSGSYPPNHRYQICRDSDDELDYEENDIDDDDEEDEDEEVGDEDFGVVDYDDPCDNDGKLGSRVRGHGNHRIIEEIDVSVVTSPEREVKVNPSGRDRSTYVNPVLNPVENLCQWKAVKAEGIPPFSKQKENHGLDEEARIEVKSEPCFRESSFSFKASSDKSKKLNQEIAVDASLYNWLGTPECAPSQKASSTGSVINTPERRMPLGSSSPSSFDDRPILGALTMEEIKQISANCSPKRSPSRSPDEMPIIGTVGTYWNDSISDRDAHSVSTFKGMPNTTSRYREDKRVKWNSTPFETRLERALTGGVAGEA